MRLLSLCALLCFITPMTVTDVALSVERVEKAEAVCFMDEWYVALVTEPVYLRSEGKKLCNTVRERIKDRCGVDCCVTIDVGLYYAIKEAKNSENRYERLSKITAIFKDRCAYEHHFHNQSQETGICTH